MIKACTTLLDIDFSRVHQLSDEEIYVGFVTRQKWRTLVSEGDIGSNVANKFYDGVRSFYEAATKYKIPLRDDLLVHARFVNFNNRENARFSDVEFFLDHYKSALQLTELQRNYIFDEFVEYQLLDEKDIPQTVWDSARDYLEPEDELEEKQTFVRMDVIWAFLGVLKTHGCCKLRFPNLSKIAHLVLVLPHSNTGEEGT